MWFIKLLLPKEIYASHEAPMNLRHATCVDMLELHINMMSLVLANVWHEQKKGGLCTYFV